MRVRSDLTPSKLEMVNILAKFVSEMDKLNLPKVENLRLSQLHDKADMERLPSPSRTFIALTIKKQLTFPFSPTLITCSCEIAENRGL